MKPLGNMRIISNESFPNCFMLSYRISGRDFFKGGRSIAPYFFVYLISGPKPCVWILGQLKTFENAWCIRNSNVSLMSWCVKFVWFVCIQVECKIFINQNLALILAWVLWLYLTTFDHDVSMYEAIALGNPLHMLAPFKFHRWFIFALLFENRDFSKTLTLLALKISNFFHVLFEHIRHFWN
jgi:hypothetical protein